MEKKAIIKKYFEVPNRRKVIYDFLRVISGMGIICLHVTAELTSAEGIFFQTISRIALPMFVLLSGALALGSEKEEGYATYYWKRFLKIVVPYIIYSAYYECWLATGHAVYTRPVLADLKTVTRLFPTAVVDCFTQPQSVHLWFVLMIIGLYLVAPFLRKGVQTLEGKDLKALFAVIIITYVVIDYLPFWGFKIGVSNFLDDWMPYFLLGYMLTKVNDRKHLSVMAIVGTLSAVVMFAWRYLSPEYTSDNYYDLAPHMMLACCGVWAIYMLLEPMITKSKAVNWVMIKLSSYAYSVYLIHLALMNNYAFLHPDLTASGVNIIKATVLIYLQSLLYVIILDNLLTKNVIRVLNMLCELVKKAVWSVVKND